MGYIRPDNLHTVTQNIQKSCVWDEKCGDTIFVIYGIDSVPTHIRTKTAFLILESGSSDSMEMISGGSTTVLLVGPGILVQIWFWFSLSTQYDQSVSGGGWNESMGGLNSFIVPLISEGQIFTIVLSKKQKLLGGGMIAVEEAVNSSVVFYVKCTWGCSSSTFVLSYWNQR